MVPYGLCHKGPSSQGYDFSSGHVWMWELDCEESLASAEELMLLNCGVGEDSWESLGLQGDPTSPFRRDQPWDFFGRNDAKAETPVVWPPYVKSWLIGKDSDSGRDWGRRRRGWLDGWMASLTRWTWVWVNSGRWWWTGRPGVLRFMGSQTVRHDWVTELNWYVYLGKWVNTAEVLIFRSVNNNS